MPEETDLYPLRFEPIFQYRLWGGRRLGELMHTQLPGNDPIGEAWILSDRDDYPSKVAEGPLAGKTLKELIAADPVGLLGGLSEKVSRYPLLLKFLDAREMLSVQVHPSDEQKDLLPPGERGKTEAWVVLEADPKSEIYAGLKAGATEETIRAGLADGTVEKDLSSFSPKPGEGVFIEAGTVHALGGGVVVFEVQQNSDVTFRLFDWNRVDEKTGKSRELHIEKGFQSINFHQGEIGPSTPVLEATQPVTTERLFDCEFFTTWRHTGSAPFPVGLEDVPRVLVCLSGSGTLAEHTVTPGQVWFIPAAVGTETFTPSGEVVLLEIGVPDTE